MLRGISRARPKMHPYVEKLEYKFFAVNLFYKLLLWLSVKIIIFSRIGRFGV